MSEYYYYEENGKLFRFHLEQDDNPWSPREDDGGLVGKMICTDRNRNVLGDERCDIERYIDNLLRENVKEISVINYIKKGKTSNNLELKYNRRERTWQLWGDYITYVKSPTDYRTWPIQKHGILNDTDQTVDWLIDDIIDALPIGDKLKLLERNGFYFLPLAIYDHSGVTMWVGSKWSGIDAQWDCSDVGFIYTTKEKIFEICGGYHDSENKFHKLTKRNWKECAEHDLRAEVKVYDMYLQGECYGYQVDRYDPEDDEWEEDVDSCWGFYSDKWGKELAREIADNNITSEPFISEADAEIAMANMRQIALEEKAERKVMEQADYMVCI